MEKSFTYTDFFELKKEVKIKKNKFSIFLSRRSGEKIQKKNQFILDDGKESILVLLHGGGANSMSWAVCAKQLKNEITICAIDLRGHGESKTVDDSDLSLETLSNDVLSILSNAFDLKKVKFLFCGHSLGGAVAVHCKHVVDTTKSEVTICGLIVVDLVEGTAVNSFKSLKSLLKQRPKEFSSINEAVKWSYQISKLPIDTLAISVPSQLRKNKKNNFVWRTPLEKSEKYWKGWYKNMSKKFLGCRSPKMLIIANMKRLDTPLTIAHMQGKFVLKVAYGTNHFLHEEKPIETIKFIVEFMGKFYLN